MARQRTSTPEAEPMAMNPRAHEKEWLNEEVTVEFMNLEEPGLLQKFCYGSTKNPKTYILFHGGKYKLPRHLVNHINTREVPNWKWVPDGTGTLNKQMVSKTPRFQCREVYV